ncbi:unnamed protein product [Zymoseptoria tritici ST99CH_3D1]|nr:unnamed protein product [Zymoseptoria tritici ST99CH_3D1]
MKQCILKGTKDRRPTNGDAFADLEKGYGTFDHDNQQSSQDGPNEPEEDFGSNWMSHLDDNIPLSALTIPGTHDSATAVSHIPFIRTQSLSITDQLALGIRYFDLRCALRQNIPVMVHGLAYLNLTLASVLSDMTAFLSAHPGEGLVVQIKQDRKPSKSDISFSRVIYLELEAIRPYLRTLPTTPTLGEARGKIQLFRRYNLSRGIRGYGIDVTQWQDNPEEPFTIHHPWFRQQLTIQDHYSFTSGTSLPSLITSKTTSVISLLDRAASDSDSDPPSHDDDDPDSAHWYINFASAFEINVWYQIPPRTIAVGGYYFLRWVDGVNARLRAWVEAKGGGKGLGIVVMDFPESEGDLVEELILTNFEQGEDGSGAGWRRWWQGVGVGLVVGMAVGLLLMAVVLAWAMFMDEQTARVVVGYLGW